MISLTPVNITPASNLPKAASWSTMANVGIREVTSFLGPKESVLKLGSLNKSTYAVIFLSNDGLAFCKVSLVADKAIEFLNSTRQPRGITSLIVTGSKKGSKKLAEIPEQINPARTSQSKIQSFTFGSAMKPIPFNYIYEIIKNVPNMHSLGFSYLSGQGDGYAFEPVNGRSLSDAMAANLASLKDLTINVAKIHPQGVTEILNCSSAFKSVFFRTHPLSDNLLTILAQKQDLQELSFHQYSDPVNYEILSDLHLLERFTPSEGISTAALIRILKSNPRLRDLSLLECQPSTITEELLMAIGQLLIGLENLHLPSQASVTEPGFVALVEGCKQLKSLDLKEVEGLTAIGLRKLDQCPELTNLTLFDVSLSDEHLAALATVTQLKNLNLYASKGFTAIGLRGLCNLINLEHLELGCNDVLTDEVVSEIVNSCPTLIKLSIDNCEFITQVSLHAISAAITTGRSHLKELTCIDVTRSFEILTLEMLDELQDACPDLEIK